MIQSKITGIEFGVDNYVEITSFSELIKDSENSFIMVALIGFIEGIIKLSKDKSYYTFAGIYKVKCSNYLLMDICSFINNNNKAFDYLINYFNLWHGNEYEEFTYDEYNKVDISDNFYELVSLLWEESNKASELNDETAIKSYNILSNYLTILYMSSKGL